MKTCELYYFRTQNKYKIGLSRLQVTITYNNFQKTIYIYDFF